MAESDRRSSAGDGTALQHDNTAEMNEEDEEEELAEAYWGDEIVMKCGNWKAVTPAATVKGAAAIVVRDPKTFLLFKDFEVSWRGKDAVSVYVSWEKPKKRVRCGPCGRVFIFVAPRQFEATLYAIFSR
jgi:hypothetical protein